MARVQSSSAASSSTSASALNQQRALSSEAELARRWGEMEAKGKDAWKPVKRERPVSAALRAYAAMTTSAAFGAVRDVTQVERKD